jgi:hypothetical protein
MNRPADIHMTTVVAADPCKSAMQIAALQIAANHIHHIGAPIAITRCETIVPYALEFFKVILNALKIIAVLGIAGAIDVRNDIFSAWFNMIAGHFQGCGNDNDQIWHNVKLNVYTYTLLCADQWRVYCRDNRRDINADKSDETLGKRIVQMAIDFAQRKDQPSILTLDAFSLMAQYSNRSDIFASAAVMREIRKKCFKDQPAFQREYWPIEPEETTFEVEETV